MSTEEPFLIFLLSEGGKDNVDKRGCIFLVYYGDSLWIQFDLLSHAQQAIDLISAIWLVDSLLLGCVWVGDIF